MSEISANVKMYALVAAIIGLLAIILSFTFGFYPFISTESFGAETTSNLFGKGEVALNGVTLAEFEADDWDSWPGAAAWIAWIGFLIVLIAGVIYFLVKSEIMALEGQDANLALGIMVGGVIALIGMIWWMIADKGASGLEYEIGDFGYGFWLHLIFAIGAGVLGYLIWSEEK
ncbi:MAG: hypothetical protein ACTSYA_02770 [Candidatus Kariarchaeaceae archaeon]